MNIHDQLVRELTYADKIILKMLKHMTIAQKNSAAIEIEEDGASGEGMTRHHERRLVLEAAKAEKPEPVFCCDCKHFLPIKGEQPRCAAPGARRSHMVIGFYKPSCMDERDGRRATCGREGMLFEPQPAASPADCSANLASLNRMNLDSSPISAITAATTSGDTPGPKIISEAALATMSRS